MKKTFTKEELEAGLSLEGAELSDDMLDAIAGGITVDEWNNLTREEQDYLRLESLLYLNKGLHCSLMD